MASIHLLCLALLINWCIACSKTAPKPEPRREIEIEYDQECKPGQRPAWIGVPNISRIDNFDKYGYSRAYVDWRGMVKNNHCVARYYVKIDNVTKRRSLLYYDTSALRRFDPYYEIELREELRKKLETRVTEDIEYQTLAIRGLNVAGAEYIFSVVAVEKQGISWESARFPYCSGDSNANCSTALLNDWMYMRNACWKYEYEAKLEELRLAIMFNED